MDATARSNNNRRVAKNTFYLYCRTAITVFISLYTSRILLDALGVDDYGVYNAVGGFVGFFHIITQALQSSVGRFLNYSMGRKEDEKLKRIFSTAFAIHVVLALIVVIVLETVGVWFLNTHMTIPDDRIFAANVVLQLSTFSFAIGLMNTPFGATTAAHEHMGFIAIMSVVGAVGKLIIAFLLEQSGSDRLIMYASMLFGFGIITSAINCIYSYKNFPETSIRINYDRKTAKEMFSFASWSFIGSTAGIIRGQGDNVLINMFFGPAINAAMGIATHVSSTLSSFYGSFMMALNPQITKNYASGEHEYMFSLVYTGARLSFFLLLFFSLPVLSSTHYILSFWLTVVPEKSVTLVWLMVAYSLFDTLTRTLITVMLATGNIRNYQIVVGGISMLAVPVAYVCLKFFHTSAESVLVVNLVIWHCCLAARLIMLKNMITYSIREYLRKVYFMALYVFAVAAAIPFTLAYYLPENFVNFLILTVVSLSTAAFSIYKLGCTPSERELLMKIVKRRLHVKQE